jgi:hypothetical protein
MKNYSSDNHYTDKHSGIVYNSAQIERYNSKAKKELFQRQRDEYGYNFCEKCKRNLSGNIILNASHNQSKAWCLKNGEIELIWDLENMEILCQETCHKIKDKLNTQFGKSKHEK